MSPSRAFETLLLAILTFASNAFAGELTKIVTMAVPEDERKAREYERAVYQGREPTFQEVASFYPPIKYPNAIVGVDGFPGEAYVGWNGDVVLPVDAHYPGKAGEGIFLQLAFGSPPALLEPRTAVRRFLGKGYLPVVTTEWEQANIQFSERVFASQLCKDVMVVLVKISIANRGPTPQPVHFWICMRQAAAASPYPPPPASPELLRDRPPVNDLPTAYVCQRFVCLRPTTEVAELVAQISLE